jgi:SpoVK/Ycf46/Vps4 family AAA+-type ATPase
MAPSEESLASLVVRAVVATGATVFSMLIVKWYVLPDMERMFQRMSDPEATKDAEGLTPGEATFARSIVGPEAPELQDASFDTVGGLDAELEALQLNVLGPLNHPLRYAHSRIAARPTGVLLHGPPGTGKTLLARCIARTAKAHFFNVQLGSILSKFYGEAEHNIEALFRIARKKKRCIIFIDEVESLFGDRQSGGQQHMASILNCFLSQWDGLVSRGDGSWTLVLGATNRREAIDRAVLRRFTTQLEVPMPGLAGRRDILGIFLRTEKCDDAVHERLEEVAAATAGFSGSELRDVCGGAALAAIRELSSVADAGGEAEEVEPRPLTTEDLLCSVQHVKRTRLLEIMPAGEGGGPRGGHDTACSFALGHLARCLRCQATLMGGARGAAEEDPD